MSIRAQNDSEHIPCVFRKTSHPKRIEDAQGWEEAKVNDTLNVFDNSETRTPTLITQVNNMKRVYDWHRQDTRMKELGDVCVTAAAGWGAVETICRMFWRMIWKQ